MKTRLFFPTGLLLLLSFFSFYAHHIAGSEEASSHIPHPWERYDTSFGSQLQSVDDLIAMADKIVPRNQHYTLRYYDTINNLIERKFYHGYSHYSMQSNPLAFIAGKFVWDHLSAIVIADEIMKHPMAACSQQALVLMEVFKRQEIPFRKVGFDHHFAVEAFLNNQWRYFDPNMEPRFTNERQSLNTLIANKNFYNSYKHTGLKPSEFDFQMGHLRYGQPNKTFAANATIFHKACLAIDACSTVGFAILAVMLLPFVFTHRKVSGLRRLTFKGLFENSLSRFP